ncbi:peptidase S15 [Mollisia scopiformis]|uniref:Peptidase S15 n=1 Tax=Mollisia scopiformis TaxID=149040 RepID=A0A194WX73_MOLSC|nr:peptidase S15 [Mollisia scopiformis]KUJ12583.1 peptidase S15 [Mollisia scopiformis]
MIVERDVPITADDGLVLRADVFRPDDEKPAPVIMTLGPYGKGVEYKDGYKDKWDWLLNAHPNILPGSTKSFETWETVDPELWTKAGYICIRVDSRGTGRSPGHLDIFAPREIKDFYDAIEWAGVQNWSNGKVGLLGISYYAITQWLVAALQPPHLAAIIPWEGAADYYRDTARHGGIVSNGFLEAWYHRQVVSNQHGNPSGKTDPWLKERATGPAELSDQELRANRCDPVQDIVDHPLDNQFYKDRTADLSKIKVPFLSASNLAGFGLHDRGNHEAFKFAASTQKWLQLHPGRHEEWFYLNDNIELQQRFFDHFLKEINNGWDKESPVLLNTRRPFSTTFELRKETEWPLKRTEWTKAYLDSSSKALSWQTAGKQTNVSFDAAGEPVTFTSAPLEQETEITGPLAAKLFISSSTTDADLFLTLQAFSPDGREVTFQGAQDPNTPLAQGWLRASHRKLDTQLSLPYRPYHSHDELQPLERRKVYEVDVEIWPTAIILPKGFTLALQIGGKDFERGNKEGGVFRGSGPFLHTHKKDRPESVFAGKTMVYTGGEYKSYVLLPIIKE